MKGKRRLDSLLLEKGLCESRHLAQSLIFEGRVKVNGIAVTKAGTQVPADSDLVIEGPRRLYVSRGGLKLEHALRSFAVSSQGALALDIGASTGGFTDCLLKAGALKVWSVDVGKGQLDYSLRNNPAVVSLEGVNARYLERSQVPGKVNIVTVDVSFISLELLFARLREFLLPGGAMIVLVKPQFEAGKGRAKKGVIRDPSLHREVLLKVIARAEAAGLFTAGATYSPLKGPAGNTEFFLHLEAEKPAQGADHDIIVSRVLDETMLYYGKKGGDHTHEKDLHC
ncbi:MAG: TlyA family RNA methyltransferase [Candidatus Eremiobacteraeota bacterium]|nr:TlyA family RNA methyltransferase [Candidatus Eremiobacteraeota bacterium]